MSHLGLSAELLRLQRVIDDVGDAGFEELTKNQLDAITALRCKIADILRLCLCVPLSLTWRRRLVCVYIIYMYVCVQGRGEAREGRGSDVAYRQELAHFIHDHMWARKHAHSSCLRLRVGVSSCAEGGVVGSAEGREEVVTHQLRAQTAHVHSTGGACVTKYCTHAHAHTAQQNTQ